MDKAHDQWKSIHEADLEEKMATCEADPTRAEERAATLRLEHANMLRALAYETARERQQKLADMYLRTVRQDSRWSCCYRLETSLAAAQRAVSDAKRLNVASPADESAHRAKLAAMASAAAEAKSAYYLHTAPGRAEVERCATQIESMAQQAKDRKSVV